MPTVNSKTEEKVWSLKIMEHLCLVKFWNVESLDNLISAQGVLTSIMQVTVPSTSIWFKKEKIWVCLTRNNWTLKWNCELTKWYPTQLKITLSSEQIEHGVTLELKNLVRSINGQLGKKIQDYWIQSSKLNLMTNSKREMLTNFFINLIKEVLMQLLNGNANFEI